MALIKQVLFLIVLLLLAGHASALGISPAQVLREFSPYYQETIKARAFSDSKEDQYITILARNPISAANLILPENRSLFLPAGGSADFFFTINLSDSLEPGIQELYVGVGEQPPAAAAGWMTTVVAVYSVVSIRVPYPGVFLRLGMDVADAKEGNPVTFDVLATSRGLETVRLITASVAVYDNDGGIIATVPLSPIHDLGTNQEGHLYGTWDTRGFPVGHYSVIASIDYDGTKKELSDEFNIGRESLEILNMTDILETGKINKFDVIVQSKWNQPIPEVYGTIQLSREGVQVQQVRTATTGFEPWEQKAISGFVDASTLEKGDYDATATMSYLNETAIKKGIVHVLEPRLLGIEMPKPSATLGITLLAFIIIIVTIINILLITRKGKKKK